MAKRYSITEAETELFTAALQEYSVESIEKAITQLAIHDKSPYMPTIGAVLEAVRTGGADVDSGAQKAWKLVLQSITRHGTYETVQFVEPAITAAVREAGGWTYLGSLPVMDRDTWFRKEFIASYKANAGKTQLELGERATPLLGQFKSHVTQIDNEGNTRKIDMPQLAAPAIVKKLADHIANRTEGSA